MELKMIFFHSLKKTRIFWIALVYLYFCLITPFVKLFLSVTHFIFSKLFCFFFSYIIVFICCIMFFSVCIMNVVFQCLWSVICALFSKAISLIYLFFHICNYVCTYIFTLKICGFVFFFTILQGILKVGNF